MKECTSFLAREFWLNGILQTRCCCLFLGFSDGSWKKALYSDESYSWELVESDETPSEENPLGDSEFCYPYKQYLPAGTKTAGELTEIELVTNNKLVVSFSSGIRLALLYDEETESEYVEVNT